MRRWQHVGLDKLDGLGVFKMSKSLRRLRPVVFGAVGMRARRLRVGRLTILQGYLD
jgi:hypothetical protein